MKIKTPYHQIMQKMVTILLMMKNGSSPDLVAKGVLNAATSENPSFGDLAANDIEQMVGQKKYI
jgi:hypothetical protein